jgi:hypothetical protein
MSEGGGEGGGGLSASFEVSFEDLWNAAKDVAILFQNGQQVSMGERAFAVPNGMQPSDISWQSDDEYTLQYSINYGSIATDWGLSTGTSVRVGVTWNYGYGTAGGENGANLIHNAYLWGVVDYSGLGQDFDISGHFSGQPVMVNGVAKLAGEIRVDMTYLSMHWETRLFDVRIAGDGGGSIRRK